MRNLPVLNSLVTVLSSLFFASCASVDTSELNEQNAHNGTPVAGYEATQEGANAACTGTVTLPESWQGTLVPVTAPTAKQQALLNNALGEPGNGKLCQAELFTVSDEVGSENNARLFRAWNSTNPGSRLGNWWAFEQPAGRVAQYRADYEICYQWSPLDKLVSCDVQPGTTVVVGTGQSAFCSEYLSYPSSASLQIYVEGASSVMRNCLGADGVFSWE